MEVSAADVECAKIGSFGGHISWHKNIIRGQRGLILQPEMKPPKIVPDPIQKEMNLLKLTLQSSLRYDPSGIKIGE